MNIIKPTIHERFSPIIAPAGKKIRLSKYPADPRKYKAIQQYSTKELENRAKDLLSEGIIRLQMAQEKLWAAKKYGILIVLQGMDAAGKDGAIKHVMSGLNPQVCRVASFKAPTSLEASHDYLWRCSLQLPIRGEIVVFNRSHYEAVLVTRVHPEVLETLPEELSLKNNKDFWSQRYEDINAFEKHLARNGILVLKFFLNISRDEQKNRLLERLNNPDKYWKISPSDFKERPFWNEYIEAFEDMLSATSYPHAPWIIVPANDKKIARAIIADTISHAIDSLDIDYPEVSKEQIKEFQKIKKLLEKT
ncbi:MAG: polyphosphate--nucleotide phosphotransferase [Burkholderiales bacterium]|jgi:PPK2 family polyphosphate:nucleotide phosphotransferase|nr:polyphosphate--nucleotide phosphotransferase [Burkholderiales bacterium]